jgi:hypothetical protein
MGEQRAEPAAEKARVVEEWAVEVTWVDYVKAGAKGPTSQFGPFDDRDDRDRFLKMQRRDRDIAATRVLSRIATYTDWEGVPDAEPTTVEERERLLMEWHAEVTRPRTRPERSQS